MGVVWRAHDELLDREVAVKELVLPDSLDLLADEERRKLIRRSLREARSAARLRHPSVIAVHDVVQENGCPWIVMELFRGRSLADVLRAGPLSPRQTGAIAEQLLSALTAAHEAGIVHRDVKPGNVLIGDIGHDAGRAVLTDFGIALVEGDTLLTRTGFLLGTPAYMAPEQSHGAPATAKSDLWSLGVTLYEAVEGRRPYGGPDSTPIRAGHLAPLLNALLRYDPAQRPDGPAALALLGRLAPEPSDPLSDQPSEAGGEPNPGTARLRPAGPPRPGRPGRPGRPRWLMAALVAALLAAGIWYGVDKAESGGDHALRSIPGACAFLRDEAAEYALTAVPSAAPTGTWPRTDTCAVGVKSGALSRITLTTSLFPAASAPHGSDPLKAAGTEFGDQRSAFAGSARTPASTDQLSDGTGWQSGSVSGLGDEAYEIWTTSPSEAECHAVTAARVRNAIVNVNFALDGSIQGCGRTYLSRTQDLVRRYLRTLTS